MKKLIKILLAVFLVVAMITSIGWYLFEFDPEFTRDMILDQAYRFEKSGNNSAAVFLYNLAYRQAKQDDSVALQLANHYKSIGNYSKAEYTLSHAIEDGAELELYIALCQTFVEQDKLRDAVIMLDKITDPQIRSQLDTMRPKAPTVSYSPGYYSQYITVSVSAEDVDVYVSKNQDYPTLAHNAYSAPISLSGGETTLYAVAVNETGLVSSLAVFNYTIGGVVEEVVFEDSAFEDAVRLQLGVSDSQVLYSNDLWSMTEFSVPSAAISCHDLRWMPNLVSLTIEGCAFDGIDELKDLTKLQTLRITDCVLSTKDLALIGALSDLTDLTLSGCYLSSIGNLAGCVNLTRLDLSNNSIRDLTALEGMTELTYLDLSNNAVISMQSIAHLTKLETLDLSYNSLNSTAPAANLVALTYLDFSANDLMKLEGLEPLTSLTYFAASHNNLISIDVLANATQIQTLLVSHNTLLDINILTNFTQLEYLDFSYNEVSTLPAFQSSCPLKLINGGYNNLTSLDSLSVLKQLQYVYMDYNKPLKNIDKLVNCSALEVVNVYGTSVTNATKLTNKGITVNYSPV